MLPRIAVTLGEPAGIGAEIVAALAATPIDADLIAIGDRDLLQRSADGCGIELELSADNGIPIARRATGSLRYVHVPLRHAAVAGQLDVRNAAYVIDTLRIASNGALHRNFDALVTAPVQKSIIIDAGFAFTGHTEFFAEQAHCDVAMMLAAPGLRVALATTHLPLAAVPAAITENLILRIARIVYTDLVRRFEIVTPRICVLGLNPHAGERGHLGREEISRIGPALKILRDEGMLIDGPLPADTAFLPSMRAKYDAYIAMYHDQGLPVLKALGFGESVNVSLGLPFVRTSVDHGTALDLAGTCRADASSLIAATELALQLVVRASAV